MARNQRFTFLCTDDDRKTLAVLAEMLQRTQSDAVRWLIRRALLEAGALEDQALVRVNADAPAGQPEAQS